ncbi:hypothetical protein K525DRAFT_271593 [Schizophyllum commune Loenen D]|nr:hypothetical protein K525DRAFT_271593 [Schizophyllum commune Loenen D]
MDSFNTLAIPSMGAVDAMFAPSSTNGDDLMHIPTGDPNASDLVRSLSAEGSVRLVADADSQDGYFGGYCVVAGTIILDAYASPTRRDG